MLFRSLQAGAERIGAGDLDSRIDVHTSDELQTLADRFNTMAEQLKESYSGLEKKVEERTAELREALSHERLASFLPIVSQLVDEGFDPRTIAAAALQMSYDRTRPGWMRLAAEEEVLEYPDLDTPKPRKRSPMGGGRKSRGEDRRGDDRPRDSGSRGYIDRSEDTPKPQRRRHRDQVGSGRRSDRHED